MNDKLSPSWQNILKQLEKIRQLQRQIRQVGELKNLRGTKKKIQAIRKLIMSGKLRQMREEYQITLEELAERMGVSAEYLMQVETGQIRPTEEQIETIQNFIERKL